MKSDSQFDNIDRSILLELQEDARISWRELAKKVDVSAPTVRDRIKRLEDMNVIEKFTINLCAKSMGYSLTAIVRFRPLPGKRHFLETRILETENIVQCDKVTGEDGYVTRVMLQDISDLDPLLDAFSDCATTHTSIVKSSLIALRHPTF